MRASADLLKKADNVFLLLVLLAGGFVFRSYFAASVMPPPERMQGETTQAYRYAVMVAEGREIPAVDSLVMRPTGMITGENSIFEEHIAGGLHRITGGDIGTFFTVFCRFFPLLSLPIIFFWMFKNGFDRSESAFGASFYAVLLPALLRTRGESLYRETVALPLILLVLMLTDSSARSPENKKLRYSIAGAVVLFAALAAWKVTGFLTLFLFIYLTFRRSESRIILPLAAAQLSASLLLSHMRHDGAIFSSASFMAITAVLSSFTGRRTVKWAGLVLSLAAAFFFGSSSTGHVSAVTIAKLKFFFTHPDDPLLLSPDARLFWVSGYTSPSPSQVLLLFGPVFLVAALGWKQFRKQAAGTLMYWLVPVSLAGYLFFDRLHVLLAAVIIPVAVSAVKGRKVLLPAVMLLFGVQSALAPGFAALIASTGLEFQETGSLLTDDELDDLLLWSSSHRGTVLCFWHLSGLLSAYAETPVVTHTFFESSRNRENIMEFAERIYGTEADLVAFMEETGAVYVIYQADFIFDRSSQGLLYLAGLTEIPDGSSAVRMQYYPESLERLHLVWQGPSLRVFSLIPEEVSLPRHFLWERRYAAFVSGEEMALASVLSPVETGIYLADNGMELLDPDMISAGLLLFANSGGEVPGDAAIELLQHLLMAHLSAQYDMECLAEDFETYLDAWGPDPQLREDLIRLLRSAGMDERADQHLEILHSTGRGQ